MADNSWGESSITYSNAPPMGAAIGSSVAYSAGTWVPIDVTSYVTGEGTYSFGITTVNSSTQSFAAKESGSNGAQLVVNLNIPDTQAPSTPTGLTATASSYSEVDLNWQAATDNVGVAGYTVYRNGSTLATVSGTTLAYSDMTAQANTTYSYTVDAFDQVGNHSAQSSPVSVTTPPPPSSLTFNDQADTYVNSSSPTSNYGSSSAWRVSNSSTVMKGFLRFTVQGLSGLSIQNVYLMVYANSSSSAGINALAVADNTWGESTITYNNAPPMGTLLGTTGPFASGVWVTIDVTSYITGDGTYSFGITTPGTTQISFAAKESGANGAQLVVNLNP